MAEKAHTPTPWFLVVNDVDGIDGDVLSISNKARIDGSFIPIANLDIGFNDPFESEQHANAAFIVRAVNSHDKLVEALKEARTLIEAEYRDPSAEPDGEWLAKDARPVHALICAALTSLDQESGQ